MAYKLITLMSKRLLQEIKMKNKKGMYWTFAGVMLVAGGTALSARFESKTAGAEIVSHPACAEYKVLCLESKEGVCVLHKDFCVRAETKGE
jgi:hypothetical protein